MHWLHNSGRSNTDISISDWQTASFAQIKKKKKKNNRSSPNTESELWEREDLLAVVKYEFHKRNKAALTLLRDMNARNHEVTLLKIKHVRLGDAMEKQRFLMSKTGDGLALLMCSFPYVRDWLNEHPFISCKCVFCGSCHNYDRYRG
jgi:integrase/recombinase XerD